MASLRYVQKAFTSLRLTPQIISPGYAQRISTQEVSCSVYNPTFLEPTTNIGEIDDQIKNGEHRDYLHLPVKAARRDVSCSVFFDPVYAQFTNYVMIDSKKEVARKILGQCMRRVKLKQLKKYKEAETDEERSQIELDPMVIFHGAIENAKPLFLLFPVPRGGIKYQVPFPITDKMAFFTACRWLRDAGRTRHKSIYFEEKMAQEFIDAYNNEGTVINKKQELHKRCEANRAFAHYRFLKG